MKENLRKPLLFLIIVVVGSVLVLFDIPLTALLPLLIIIGFATLLALGSITLPEIRGAVASIGNSGILKRLNDMKFFEKSPEGTPPAAAKPAPAPAPVKKEEPKKKGSEEKPGLAAHISTLFASIRSVGSILQQKGKREKKVEEIDKLLDKTVTEKVSAPPPAAPAPAMPAKPGGAGGAQLDMDDPFMSLSADEFDAGLLDGLGDDEGPAPASPAPAAPALDAGGLSSLSAEGPDLPAPELDVDSAASDILKQAGESAGDASDEISGLDSGSLSDEDFGDLDNLNLDDVSLDADLEEGGAASAPAPAPATSAPQAPAAAAAPSDSNAVKTAWIPSDAPKDAGETGDEISTQADMAAFASGGPGGDEDLLSSLAADVKHVKKEQDLSLLRELKDFRAPATEIEKELGGMYERMSAGGKPARKKELPATKGIK